MARARRPDELRRLAVLHGLNAAGDAFFAVSLADSLFFNVSVEAARPRLLLYLALTMAPFAVLAPLIGPFIDRIRGGQRTVLVLTCVGRSALALALVADLRTLLMFPEAFGVLVLGKAYSIGRSAIVPRLVSDEARLVHANAFLARVGLAASAIGGGTAALVLVGADAPLVLAGSTVLFVLAGAVALTIPSPAASGRRPTRAEFQELHTFGVSRAIVSMGLLRAAVGALTFMLAFALRRSGAPVWHYGAVIAGGGVGALVATMVSSRLRERYSEERILVFALAMPAAMAMLGALHFRISTAVLVSVALGAAAGGGKHVFDALVQRTAPDANLARAFAGFETRFQIFWISGAALAILAQVDGRLGLLVISVVLAAAAIVTDISLGKSTQFEPAANVLAAVTRLVLDDAPVHDAPLAVVDAAEVLLKGGSRRAAIVVAVAALDAHADAAGRERPPPHEPAPPVDATRAELGRLRHAAITGGSVSVADAERAIATVRALLAPTSAP